MEKITRSIGPVPNVPPREEVRQYGADDCPTLGDGRFDPFAAPVGPSPMWGGYTPVRALTCTWGLYKPGEIPALWSGMDREREKIAPAWGHDEGGQQWWAHSAPTPLLLKNGEWWVGAPARPAYRAVYLLRAAGTQPLKGVLECERAYVLAYPRGKNEDPELKAFALGFDDPRPFTAGLRPTRAQKRELADPFHDPEFQRKRWKWLNATERAEAAWAFACGRIAKEQGAVEARRHKREENDEWLRCIARNTTQQAGIERVLDPIVRSFNEEDLG